MQIKPSFIEGRRIFFFFFFFQITIQEKKNQILLLHSFVCEMRKHVNNVQSTINQEATRTRNNDQNTLDTNLDPG